MLSVALMKVIIERKLETVETAETLQEFLKSGSPVTKLYNNRSERGDGLIRRDSIGLLKGVLEQDNKLLMFVRNFVSNNIDYIMEGCERNEEREKFLLIPEVLVPQAVVILLKKEVNISEKKALLEAIYADFNKWIILMQKKTKVTFLYLNHL